MTGTVQTVRGPVDPTQIGFTLPHEHTYTRFYLPQTFSGPLGAASQTEDEDVLAEELGAFAERGGSCVVDVTLRGIGRSPERVRALAERTGLHMVLGCGWYIEPYYEPEAYIDRRSVESLAEELVREITDGIDGTGIRPGVIGEIGAARTWISAQEERVHRAAARAQAATGLALTTHALLSRVGLDQLRLFDAEGADLSRVIVGHCDWYPDLAFYLEVIGTGATVQLDMWGYPSVRQRGVEEKVLRLLLELIERGHADRVLLSHDVDHVGCLRQFGGNGYVYVHDVVLPRLRDNGVPQAVIDQITIANPRRLLTVERPAEGAPRAA